MCVGEIGHGAAFQMQRLIAIWNISETIVQHILGPNFHDYLCMSLINGTGHLDVEHFFLFFAWLLRLGESSSERISLLLCCAPLTLQQLQEFAMFLRWSS